LSSYTFAAMADRVRQAPLPGQSIITLFEEVPIKKTL
jgi:hypothetical protein